MFQKELSLFIHDKIIIIILSGTICPNATWSGNSTIVINNNLNSTYWASFNDFFVDNYNNIYVLDTYSYRVLKYALNNPSTFNVVAVTSVSSSYLPNNLYVDGNGTIYTAESWVRTL